MKPTTTWLICWYLLSQYHHAAVLAQPWSYTVAIYPGTSANTWQYNNRFFAPAHIMATLTTTGVIFCNYFNGTSTVCRSTGLTCNTGHFYAPGLSATDEGTTESDRAVYFYCTGYGAGMVDQMAIFVVDATPSGVNVTALEAVPVPPGTSGLDIDWSHRWMVVTSTRRLLLYDLVRPRMPVLSDTYNMTAGAGDGHPRPTSIRKNLVCSSTNAGCVSIHPTRGKFIPGFVGRLATGRSVRVFDDYIVLWNTGVHVYSRRDFTLLGSALSAGGYGIIDVIRSGNFIFANELSTGKTYVLDITNPRSIQVITSTTSSGFHTLFMDRYAIYTSFWGPSGLRVINMNVPGGYPSFYANSEWYNYAISVNTLAVSSAFQPNRTFYYGQSYVHPLTDTLVQDTYAPANLTITYTITTTAPDYVIEKRAVIASTTYTLLTNGTTFTQDDLTAGLIRLRYLNRTHPLSRPSNQTITITANNGRGSLLAVTLSLSFVYGGDGRPCPDHAECALSSFTCLPGYTLDSYTGTQCTPDTPMSPLSSTSSTSSTMTQLLPPEVSINIPPPNKNNNNIFILLIFTNTLYLSLFISAVVVLLLLIIILVILFQLRRRRRRRHYNTKQQQQQQTTMMESTITTTQMTTMMTRNSTMTSHSNSSSRSAYDATSGITGYSTITHTITPSTLSTTLSSSTHRSMSPSVYTQVSHSNSSSSKYNHARR